MPTNTWQSLATAYLSFASVAQTQTLLFYLNQQDFVWSDYVAYLTAHVGESISQTHVANIIQRSKNSDYLQHILTHYSHWVAQNPSHWLWLSLMIAPEQDFTQRLLQNYLNVTFNSVQKSQFFKQVPIKFIQQYQRFAEIFGLNPSEYVSYSDHLPTWEQLLFLIDLIELEYADKNALVDEILTVSLQTLAGKVNDNQRYYCGLNDSQKSHVKQFLQNPIHQAYFLPMAQKLQQLGLWEKLSR